MKVKSEGNISLFSYKSFPGSGIVTQNEEIADLNLSLGVNEKIQLMTIRFGHQKYRQNILRRFQLVMVMFQTNKGSSQIRAGIPYLTDQIRAKVSLTLICSGLPLFD